MLECNMSRKDQPLVTRFLNSQVKLKVLDRVRYPNAKTGQIWAGVNPIALLSTTVDFGWLMINAKE